MYVLLGHNKHNTEKHCSDGDSVYITGSVHNELVRLLGIDAFEIRGLNLNKLKESKFLHVLDDTLRAYLEPTLTEDSIDIHKRLGIEAKIYLESILEENLCLSFGREVFDRYGRALVYLSYGEETYNINLVHSGHAIPYFIYPNSILITEEGKYSFEHIGKMQKAAEKARKNRKGVWDFIDEILLPMELRFLTRRELPAKYCADLKEGVLHPSQHYYKVPIVDRLFFYPKDVVLAVQMGFNPSPDCDSWLHKIWRGLHPPPAGNRDTPEEQKIREKIK